MILQKYIIFMLSTYGDIGLDKVTDGDNMKIVYFCRIIFNIIDYN